MTEESLQKIFADIKSAPAETNIAEVSQWIDAAAVTGGGTIIEKILQKKLFIMSSIIAATIISTIVLFSTEDSYKKEKQGILITEKDTTSTIPTITIQDIEKNKSENLLPLTSPSFIDSSVDVNLIPSQKEAPSFVNEISKIGTNDTVEIPARNGDYNSSGAWVSSNDSLHVDTVFNGVKALVFKGRVNNEIKVNGSNRSNVAMSYNYKYKVKGIYTRKNREYEVNYEKKDSVLIIEIERKNSVNIGVSYSKETSNLLFEVPENISVQIKTSFGDIDASGLKNNEYDFQTTYGDIKATLLSGNINLYSGYGDIDLNDLNGKIDIQTSYGNIKGNKITISEQINLKSGYGKIDCQISNLIADCELDLKTGYGKVKINRTDQKLESSGKLMFGVGKNKITAKSGYGDVIIR
jgi:hypothetical protein